MQRIAVTEGYIKSDRTLYGGLLGVAIVTSVQLLGTSPVDGALMISTYAFALTIPLLCVSLHEVMQEEQYRFTIEPGYVLLANCIGVFSAFVGVAALFWHFSAAAGLLFLVSASCSGMCHLHFDGGLQRANQDEAAGDSVVLPPIQ